MNPADTLSLQLVADKIEHEREYRFHPTRRWRFDFAWPEQKIATEVEGGIWNRGAHVRGKHFISDCEKYNEAALAGWTVLRFVTSHVERGYALFTIKRALGLVSE